MGSIILHNAKEDMKYLIPYDSINYIVECDTGVKVILKYPVAGVTYMEVDENIDYIYRNT